MEIDNNLYNLILTYNNYYDQLDLPIFIIIGNQNFEEIGSMFEENIKSITERWHISIDLYKERIPIDISVKQIFLLTICPMEDIIINENYFKSSINIQSDNNDYNLKNQILDNISDHFGKNLEENDISDNNNKNIIEIQNVNEESNQINDSNLNNPDINENNNKENENINLNKDKEEKDDDKPNKLDNDIQTFVLNKEKEYFKDIKTEIDFLKSFPGFEKIIEEVQTFESINTNQISNFVDEKTKLINKYYSLIIKESFILQYFTCLNKMSNDTREIINKKNKEILNDELNKLVIKNIIPNIENFSNILGFSKKFFHNLKEGMEEKKESSNLIQDFKSDFELNNKEMETKVLSCIEKIKNIKRKKIMIIEKNLLLNNRTLVKINHLERIRSSLTSYKTIINECDVVEGGLQKPMSMDLSAINDKYLNNCSVEYYMMMVFRLIQDFYAAYYTWLYKYMKKDNYNFLSEKMMKKIRKNKKNKKIIDFEKTIKKDNEEISEELLNCKNELTELVRMIETIDNENI